MQNRMCAIGIIASPWRRACHSLESGWNERAQNAEGSVRACKAMHRARRGQAGPRCMCARMNNWCGPGAKAEVPTYCQAERDPAASDAPIVRDVRLARAPVCESEEPSPSPTSSLNYMLRQASWATCGAQTLLHVQAAPQCLDVKNIERHWA